MYLKGVPMRVPMWVAVLEAAGGDPLRAMEIEERISEEWWERWVAFDHEKAAVKKEQP